MSFVVDTHALVWYLTGDKRLSAKAKATLDATANSVYIPAIVLVEAAWMVEHGRSPMLSLANLLKAVQSNVRLTFVPLTLEIIQESLLLRSINEIHDRQIVATAIWLAKADPDLLLITNDRMITASNAVSVLW